MTKAPKQIKNGMGALLNAEPGPFFCSLACWPPTSNAAKNTGTNSTASRV